MGIEKKQQIDYKGNFEKGTSSTNLFQDIIKEAQRRAVRLVGSAGVQKAYFQEGVSVAKFNQEIDQHVELLQQTTTTLEASFRGKTGEAARKTVEQLLKDSAWQLK